MNISKSAITSIGDNYNLDFIILHGSRAIGGIRGPETDLDIAIYRQGGIGKKEYLEIYSKMMSMFKGEDLDLKVLNNKNPLFYYHVLKDGKLLYGDSTLFNDLKAYAYKRYVDALPLFTMERSLLKKRMKSLKRSLNA